MAEQLEKVEKKNRKKIKQMKEVVEQVVEVVVAPDEVEVIVAPDEVEETVEQVVAPDEVVDPIELTEDEVVELKVDNEVVELVEQKNGFMAGGKFINGYLGNVSVTVDGKEIHLSLTHIMPNEPVEATFEWNTAPEGFKIIGRKSGKRIAHTILYNGLVIFESLTAQAVFRLLEAKFGWSRNTSNRIYVKSNPCRVH